MVAHLPTETDAVASLGPEPAGLSPLDSVPGLLLSEARCTLLCTSVSLSVKWVEVGAIITGLAYFLRLLRSFSEIEQQVAERMGKCSNMLSGMRWSLGIYEA